MDQFARASDAEARRRGGPWFDTCSIAPLTGASRASFGMSEHVRTVVAPGSTTLRRASNLPSDGGHFIERSAFLQEFGQDYPQMYETTTTRRPGM